MKRFFSLYQVPCMLQMRVDIVDPEEPEVKFDLGHVLVPFRFLLLERLCDSFGIHELTFATFDLTLAQAVKKLNL